MIFRSGNAVLSLVVAGAVALAGSATGGRGVQAAASESATTLMLYVVNTLSGSVTPINTITGQAGPPIRVGQEPQNIVIAPHGQFAYVTDQGAVTPINLLTNRPGKPIKVADPLRIVITPDGKTVYVLSNDHVVPIHTATGKLGHPIWAGFGANRMALTPNGQTLYVTDLASDTVIPISTATNRRGPSIKVKSSPYMVAITPDGRTALILSDGWNVMTPIDTATNKAGKPIPTGGDPGDIAIAPNSQTAYVLDGARYNSITPVNLARRKLGKSIVTKSIGLAGLVLSPNGRWLYVVPVGYDDLVPINTATGRKLKAINLDRGGASAVFTPNGKVLYVTTGRDAVTPIVVATDTELAPIKVGTSPSGLAFAELPAEG